MKFVTMHTAFLLIIEFSATAFAEMVPYTKQWDVKLQSLPPSEVLTRLDLDRPGLESVKEAAAKGNQSRALAELLRYYRGKYPPSPKEHGITKQTIEAADRLCRHMFQWGPYDPVDYGTDILITVGRKTRRTAQAAREMGLPRGSVFMTNGVDKAAEILRAIIEPGDVVLIKGSRFLGLERLVDLVA